MTLIKNNIPILEYDTDQNAVIMPGHSQDYHFPQKAAMLFMEQEINEYVKTHKCEIIGQFESITKIFNVYKTIHNKEEICFVQAPLGGAASVQIMEQMIAAGVKNIIATGCCGTLEDDNEGDFLIPVSALRQEGTSYQYLPAAREVDLNEIAIRAIETALIKKEIPYHKCKTWTTDGFYRETKEMVLYRKSEGYSVVEMECASLAACAKMRNIIFGQILFTADSLANIEKHNTRNWGKNTFAAAMQLALDAVAEINI